MKTLYRIGQIVPSSNITMETEIPAMLQARQLIRPERLAFHSSRMRMNEVSKDDWHRWMASPIAVHWNSVTHMST
jgi:maleate isomerase